MTTTAPPAAPPLDPVLRGFVPEDAARWRVTRALMRSDLDRVARHLQQTDSWIHRAYFWLLPGSQALFWHRLSRWLFLNEWKRLARFVSLFAIYLTRAEIPPTTMLGPAALIPHATNVHLFGRIGARVTVQGDGGCGGGFGIDDIGGGPGYAVVGDDVTFAFGARVLGPVRIGDGVHIGPGALVTSDVPAGSLVLWAKPRVIVGGAVPDAGASGGEGA